MASKSTPKKKADDRTFPIRIRIEMPPMRAASWLTDFYKWLDTNAPRAHALHSDTFIGEDEPKEGMLIYLKDAALVSRMVQEMGLDLLEGPKSEYL